MSAPYADLWNFAGQQRDPGGPALSSTSPDVQKLIDAGHVTRTDRWYSNEGGEGEYIQDNVDWGAPGLPTMGPGGAHQFGNWVPVMDAQKELINPAMVYNDPNYGMIAPSSNQKSNLGDWQDLIGPMLMAVVTAGAGSAAAGAAAAGAAGIESGAGAGLGAWGGSAAADAGLAGFASSAPSWLNSGMSVARQIGGGNPTVSGLAGALLPGLGEFGIPSSITQGLSLANSGFSALQKNTSAPMVNPEQGYNPGLYGNMGSLAAPSDGSERVATGIAPGAYANSYNQVIS